MLTSVMIDADSLLPTSPSESFPVGVDGIERVNVSDTPCDRYFRFISFFIIVINIAFGILCLVTLVTYAEQEKQKTVACTTPPAKPEALVASVRSVDIAVSPNMECGLGWLRQWQWDHQDEYALRTFLYVNSNEELESLHVLPSEMASWTVEFIGSAGHDAAFLVHTAFFSDSMEEITVVAADELTETDMAECIRGAQLGGYQESRGSSFCVRRDAVESALHDHQDYWLYKWGKYNIDD